MTETVLMTETETREVTRQRRALQQSIADAEEDLVTQQVALDAATDAAKDITNTKADKQVTSERAKMRELTKALAAAKVALAEFNRSNPTEDDIQAAERVIATEAVRQAREQARRPFIENRKKAIQLFERLLTLDAEARQMVHAVPSDTFRNGAEAVDLSDLILNWNAINKENEGLQKLRRALQSI